MPTLLHIDVSPRGDWSISRKLSAAFAEQWKAKNPGGTVRYLDLATTPLPFVDLPWIAGAYSAPEQHTPEQKNALSVSDQLIAQLLEADEVVIGTPMYNFSTPARLKAWIDHVVRFGKTFIIDENGLKGLAAGRPVTIVIASGGNYTPGSPTESMNHEGPYLKTILGFIGITDVRFVLAGDTNDVTQGKVSAEAFLEKHLKSTLAAV